MNVFDRRRTPLLIAAVAGLATAGIVLVGCEEHDEPETGTLGASTIDQPEVSDPQLPRVEEASRARSASLSQPPGEPTDDETLGGVQSSSRDGMAETRMVFAGASGEGGLRVTRTGPEQVRLGEPFEYEVTVENISELPAHGVVVQEALPASMQVHSENGQKSQRDGSARESESYTIGTMRPGASETFTVQGVAQRVGQAMVCMAVDFDQTMCSTMQVVQPELRLERLVLTDSPVYICDDIEVRYILTNTGSGQTSEAMIMEELPEGFSYQGQRRVQLSAGTLDGGESFEQTIVVSAQGLTKSMGRFGGQAQARAGEMSAQSEQGQAIAVLRPELDVRIDGPGEHYVGWPTTYRIIVENTSDAPALRTVLNLSELAGVDRASYSPSRLTREGNTIEIGRLDPGQQQIVEVSMLVEDPRELSITASANAYCVQAVEDQLTTNFKGIAALRLETIDMHDPVPLGEETAYEVRVKNQGSALGTNIRITAELPEQMEFLGGQGDSSVTIDGAQITFAPITSLPPGEMATWRIRVRAVEAGKVRLNLSMESDSQKTVREQEPTNLFDPQGG